MRPSWRSSAGQTTLRIEALAINRVKRARITKTVAGLSKWGVSKEQLVQAVQKAGASAYGFAHGTSCPTPRHAPQIAGALCDLSRRHLARAPASAGAGERRAAPQEAPQMHQIFGFCGCEA